MLADQSKIATKAGWISILVNIVLFALKYWAGLASGSVAIIADAWHTLSDSISSLAVIIGVWVSVRPADKDHPFGHGRAEMLAAIIIGVILAVVAFEFGMESIRRIANRESADYGTIAIVVTAISVVTKEGLARYALWAGKKSGSRSLKADAWHHRSDALSSVVILAGIFLSKYAWWIDGVLGMLVALLILNAAWGILRDTFHSLLGEKPEKELVERIMEICGSKLDDKVFPHHIHVHNYGDHTEMTLHIKLPKDTHLGDAHDLASLIEDAIRNELNIEATIHMEPISGRFMEKEPGSG